MMNVFDNELVVEVKGIHSVEKFLISRHLMYHQVYLHKASISAEQMLKAFIVNFKKKGLRSTASSKNLDILFNSDISISEDQLLSSFLKIDDYDVFQLIKGHLHADDTVLRLLSNGIIHRELFKTTLSEEPFDTHYKNELFVKCSKQVGLNLLETENIVIFGIEENAMYRDEDEIYLVEKNRSSKVTLSKLTRLRYHEATHRYHFVTHPKLLDAV